jgi:hypothetical protein
MKPIGTGVNCYFRLPAEFTLISRHLRGLLYPLAEYISKSGKSPHSIHPDLTNYTQKLFISRQQSSLSPSNCVLVTQERLKLISCCKSPHAYMALQEQKIPSSITPRLCYWPVAARSMIDAIPPTLQSFLWIVCNLKENQRGLLPNTRGGNIKYSLSQSRLVCRA